jgi:hypothetical protein
MYERKTYLHLIGRYPGNQSGVVAWTLPGCCREPTVYEACRVVVQQNSQLGESKSTVTSRSIRSKFLDARG